MVKIKENTTDRCKNGSGNPAGNEIIMVPHKIRTQSTDKRTDRTYVAMADNNKTNCGQGKNSLMEMQCAQNKAASLD